jgi:transcriptional regulator with XRE-family HTH domain
VNGCGGFAEDPALDGGAGTGDAELDHAAEVLQALGAKIRAAREAAGVTQNHLAGELGVTQTAVSYWEAGKRDPGVIDLLRIAEELKVPAAALLPDQAPKAAQRAAEGRFARVEVKGFRDLGIVRVTESTLAGEPMLRAESTDGAVAEFPPSSLHFITWLPEGVQVRSAEPAAIGIGDTDDDDWFGIGYDSSGVIG